MHGFSFGSGDPSADGRSEREENHEKSSTQNSSSGDCGFDLCSSEHHVPHGQQTPFHRLEEPHGFASEDKSHRRLPGHSRKTKNSIPDPILQSQAKEDEKRNHQDEPPIDSDGEKDDEQSSGDSEGTWETNLRKISKECPKNHQDCEGDSPAARSDDSEPDQEDEGSHREFS